MSAKSLDVWLYGTHIASVQESRPGRLSLSWSADAVDRWGRGARLLSAKLSIGSPPPDPLVKVYLDGLLPEGNARVNQAMSAGIPPADTFALLEAYGRDTPGAAIFVPQGHGDPTRAGHYEPITMTEVADRLRRADEYQAADPHEAGESSTLPGMVPKITLHREGDSWLACKDGAPSTWILKRGGNLGVVGGDIIDTEVACLSLARQVGLTDINAEVVDFGTLRAIAVSRYDRTERMARIHQEDLAQGLGLNTGDPVRKFQWGGRMPTLRGAADILRLDGGNPDALLRLVAFSFLVGNTDMHAKNISFLRHDDGRVELSPAYDIAMHLHHEREGRRSALDIHGKFRMDEITIRDVVDEGRSWGLPSKRAQREVAEVVDQLRFALDTTDPGDHPGVPDRAWDVVLQRTLEASIALGTRGAESRHMPTTPRERRAAVSRTAAQPGQAPTRRGPRKPR